MFSVNLCRWLSWLFIGMGFTAASFIPFAEFLQLQLLIHHHQNHYSTSLLFISCCVSFHIYVSSLSVSLISPCLLACHIKTIAGEWSSDRCIRIVAKSDKWYLPDKIMTWIKNIVYVEYKWNFACVPWTISQVWFKLVYRGGFQVQIFSYIAP